MAILESGVGYCWCPICLEWKVTEPFVNRIFPCNKCWNKMSKPEKDVYLDYNKEDKGS